MSYRDSLLEVLDLRLVKVDLEDEIKQVYIDMEQEAEPEGGPIADRYGAELEDLENQIIDLKGKFGELEESVNEDPDHTHGLTIKGRGFDWKTPKYKRGDKLKIKLKNQLMKTQITPMV